MTDPMNPVSHPQSASPSDRRRHPRAEHNSHVAVILLGPDGTPSQEFHATTWDVGSGGTCLIAAQPITPGTPLVMIIARPGDEASRYAYGIARSSGPWGRGWNRIGLEFGAVPEEIQRSAWFTALKQRHGKAA